MLCHQQNHVAVSRIGRMPQFRASFLFHMQLDCVCSKNSALNRGSGFVFLICTLTLRGEHFVHPFVFSISLVLGVANRDGARLFFIPFSPKSCNVAMLQCCRALSLSVRRRGRIFKRKDERQFFKFYLSFKRVAHLYYNKYII